MPKFHLTTQRCDGFVVPISLCGCVQLGDEQDPKWELCKKCAAIADKAMESDTIWA